MDTQNLSKMCTCANHGEKYQLEIKSNHNFVNEFAEIGQKLLSTFQILKTNPKSQILEKS